MITIKFDKSVKYKGVRYDAHEVFKVADEDIDNMKKAGATVLSIDSATPLNSEPDNLDESENDDDTDGQQNNTDEDVNSLKEELLGYTVSELNKFAQNRGIDLQGKTRKADIYNVIVATLN